MKKILILIFCAILTTSLVGCWDQKIYERSGFALQIGFEPDGSDKILMSFLTPVVDPEAKERTELIYNEENLLREFREAAKKTSDKLIEGGKIQQVLISDTLARKGINNLLELIEREPTDPTIAYVAIVEGSVLQMEKASKEFTDKPPRTSVYVHDLLENNIESSYIPENRIFQFSTKYFSPGIDPMAPILRLQTDKGKGIEVIGSALFTSDKMVGKINTKETSLLLAMMGKMKKTTFISKKILQSDSGNNKNGCAVGIDKAKRKISVKIINNIPEVEISLNLKASISEFKWNKNYDEKFQNSIEKILSSEIKIECEKVLKYTQDVCSDPIGIGDMIRAHNNSYWQNVKWEEVYKNVVFNVNVHVNIINHGAIT